jgi:hypothetical protein
LINLITIKEWKKQLKDGRGNKMEATGKCLRCNKDYKIPHEKYRFCVDCRRAFGDETYLDNHAIGFIKEKKDRRQQGERDNG